MYEIQNENRCYVVVNYIDSIYIIRSRIAIIYNFKLVYVVKSVEQLLRFNKLNDILICTRIIYTHYIRF